MFGLGKNDDEQRMWNMVLFKMPLTDKEIQDAAPCMIGIVVALVVGTIIWVVMSR